MRFRSVAALAALTLALAACSGGGGGTDPSGGGAATGGTVTDGGGASSGVDGAGELVAIATTTQLADVADQVARCAGGSVRSLMSPGADPHEFAVSSAQIAEMTRVPLVIVNGLGLEAGMSTAIENAELDGAHIIEIAPLVDPIPFAGGVHDHADGEHADGEHADGDHADGDHADGEHDDEGAGNVVADEHDHSGDDPHIWLDASRMARAAEIIGDELAAVTGENAYGACGAEVSAELEALHVEIAEILSPIVPQNRRLVTDHQSWGYFADAYDFEQVGVVIPGGSTDAEPSSDQLAALVATVRETGVPAIFSNNAGATRLIDAVASEVGDVRVVELYEGSLGPEGSDAETYAGMMRTNARLIVETLG
nr:zinc ABC transporter substrate-binding protein [Actinomycetales bacterium]